MEKFDNTKDRVTEAFRQTYGRSPTEAEVQATVGFFSQFMPAVESGTNRQSAEQLTMATFCQGLFSAAEFRYLY